jgi:hypothetical protein
MWNPGGGQQLWQCTVWRHHLLTSYLGADPYNMCEVLVRVRSRASVKSSSSEGATERAGLLAYVWFWPVASWDIIVVHCALRNCYLGNVWVIFSPGVVIASPCEHSGKPGQLPEHRYVQALPLVLFILRNQF